MVDQLITVDSDRGPVEPEPVTVFYNGLAIDFATLLGSGSNLAPTLVSRLAQSAASTNPTLVRASAGRLFKVTGKNANAADRYLKFYNQPTTPTVGSSFPFLVIVLEASGAFDLDFGGLLFAGGISYGITTGVLDNDTGAVAAGDILALNITYSPQ